MEANTIEEVIEILDEIIVKSKNASSPLGYFAALYRQVTIAVKEGIQNGDFEDGPRMERLDVNFANRYLKAYHHNELGEQPSNCWYKAFEASENDWILVLQHLLLGINAHINLDLAIAAVETSPGESIHDLKNDFNKINLILSKLVEEVEEDLSFVLPILEKILKLTGELDNFFVDFSMEKARDGAWKWATELAAMAPDETIKEIALRDQKITKLATVISHTGLIVKLIKVFERGSIPKRIEILSQ